MESEKVKEIKELLRCMNGEKACTNCYINEVAEEQETFCINVVADMTLDLINELESENERLMKLQARGGCRVAELGIENQQLKDRIAEMEKELEKEQINNLNCDTELQYKEKRIAELEKENGELLKENEGYHGSYRCAIDKIGELSAERYIKVEQFAERLKEKIVSMKWAREDTNEKLIKQGATIKAIDETLKEFIDE
jgi:chromosome segregation ATPase